MNFLDKSAEDYLGVLKDHLLEKGLKPDKPIAFLCNPPYRSDEDQAAESVSYRIHPSIVDLTGNDAASERYCCFLAQMKLICEKAESSGLPGNSLLLLFTKAAWLTDRRVFQKTRREIFSSFEDVGGVIVNSKEFFDVKVSFPIAFTIWRYNSSGKQLNPERPTNIIDLTWVKKSSLASINWNSVREYSPECEKIIEDRRSILVSFGSIRPNIKVWTGLTSKDFKRNRRKSEIEAGECGGLPKGDRREGNKKTYGESDGQFVGFMDDVTPTRIKTPTDEKPWFRLNN